MQGTLPHFSYICVLLGNNPNRHTLHFACDLDPAAISPVAGPGLDTAGHRDISAPSVTVPSRVPRATHHDPRRLLHGPSPPITPCAQSLLCMAALWRRRMACSRPRCLHHYRHKQFLARRELVLGNDIEPGMLFPNSRGVTPKSFSKVRNVLETFIFLHDTEIFGETPHFSNIIVRSSPI